MSVILKDTKYMIHCHFVEKGRLTEPQIYIGTLEELQRTIATTWSKIPRRVVQVDYTVQVHRKEDSTLLANFTFSPIHRTELPDHF